MLKVLRLMHRVLEHLVIVKQTVFTERRDPLYTVFSAERIEERLCEASSQEAVISWYYWRSEGTAIKNLIGQSVNRSRVGLPLSFGVLLSVASVLVHSCDPDDSKAIQNEDTNKVLGGGEGEIVLCLSALLDCIVSECLIGVLKNQLFGWVDGWQSL